MMRAHARAVFEVPRASKEFPTLVVSTNDKKTYVEMIK
jgi:hypothetical protein